MFQNVKTVQQQGSLISILTGSSKICLWVKVLCIWFNLCWRFLVPCSPCVISSAVQLYYVLVATISHISSETNPPPPLLMLFAISGTVSWHKLRSCYSSNMLQHWVGGKDLIYFYKVDHSRISINFSWNWLGLNNLCEIL